jgi:hypothetical protein
MSLPAGAIVIEFDPHIIWAMLSVFVALVVTFLVIAAQADNQRGRGR